MSARRRRLVHFLVTSDAKRTACGIYLFASSNRLAPSCSTEPAHVTCPDCEGSTK